MHVPGGGGGPPVGKGVGGRRVAVGSGGRVAVCVGARVRVAVAVCSGPRESTGVSVACRIDGRVGPFAVGGGVLVAVPADAGCAVSRRVVAWVGAACAGGDALLSPAADDGCLRSLESSGSASDGSACAGASMPRMTIPTANANVNARAKTTTASANSILNRPLRAGRRPASESSDMGCGRSRCGCPGVTIPGEGGGCPRNSRRVFKRASDSGEEPRGFRSGMPEKMPLVIALGKRRRVLSSASRFDVLRASRGSAGDTDHLNVIFVPLNVSPPILTLIS